MPSSFDLILKNGKCFIDGQLKTIDIGISDGIIKNISKIEKIEPITEAHPLIPQAQGMPCLKLLFIQVKPKGKGIPIKKASGAITKKVINNFVTQLKEMELSNIGVRIKI